MLQVWAHVRASDSIREALEQEAARTLEALGTAQAAPHVIGESRPAQPQPPSRLAYLHLGPARGVQAQARAARKGGARP